MTPHTKASNNLLFCLVFKEFFIFLMYGIKPGHSLPSGQLSLAEGADNMILAWALYSFFRCICCNRVMFFFFLFFHFLFKEWMIDNVVVPVATGYGLAEEYEYLKSSVQEYLTGLLHLICLCTSCYLVDD